MTKLRLFTMLLVCVFALAAVSAGASNWYVVKHSAGQMAVTDYRPGHDWSIVSGPYRTQDEAARAGGVNPATESMNVPYRTSAGKRSASVNWHVVRNTAGQTTVTDYKPGHDWSVVSGPYRIREKAARAGGVTQQALAGMTVPRAGD